MGERKRHKVEEALRESLSQIILFEMKDPRLGFVTVTRVEVTRDLMQAKVGISVLGPKADRAKSMRCLEHARGYLQEQIGRRLRLMRVPTLRFEYDDSTQRAAEVLRLIDEAIKQDRREE